MPHGEPVGAEPQAPPSCAVVCPSGIQRTSTDAEAAKLDSTELMLLFEGQESHAVASDLLGSSVSSLQLGGEAATNVQACLCSLPARDCSSLAI